MCTNQFNLLTSADIEENTAVQQWRTFGKNREQNRNSSNHYSTLSQQIQDKFQQKQNDEKVSNAYECDHAKYQSIIQLLEHKQEQDRRNLQRDINEFRAAYQKPTDAREYDLNNPDQTSIVYNQGDNQLKYGPGSCVFFEGEDRNKKDREKKQKEQMNQWIKEQCYEKYEDLQKQQSIDQAYNNYQLMVVERVKDLEIKQKMLRRQLDIDLKMFNYDLAMQRQCQRNMTNDDK